MSNSGSAPWGSENFLHKSYLVCKSTLTQWGTGGSRWSLWRSWQSLFYFFYFVSLFECVAEEGHQVTFVICLCRHLPLTFTCWLFFSKMKKNETNTDFVLPPLHKNTCIVKHLFFWYQKFYPLLIKNFAPKLDQSKTERVMDNWNFCRRAWPKPLAKVIMAGE